SVMPKPRSSGSAIIVPSRRGSPPSTYSSFSGRISSCQFFWITTPPLLFNALCWCKAVTALRPVSSDPAALRRPAAIVRNRRHVTDGGNGKPYGLQGAERGLAARTGSLHLDFQRLHAMFHRLLAGFLRRHLGGE